MIPSFIILAIVCVSRLIIESLLGIYSFLAMVVPYLNWACIGLAVVFGVFVLINILKAVFSKG